MATEFCSHAKFAVSHDFSSHVSMCLFIWAHILNMHPHPPPRLFSYQGETVENGPSSPLCMETSLLFWYADKSDDSFWRGDTLAGVLRDVEGRPGFTITPPSQGQASSRGASDVVISWDVRDRLPQGWKCNKTDNSNKRWRKYRLELSYKGAGRCQRLSYKCKLVTVWVHVTNVLAFSKYSPTWILF